jgi:hypothetical protein
MSPFNVWILNLGEIIESSAHTYVHTYMQKAVFVGPDKHHCFCSLCPRHQIRRRHVPHRYVHATIHDLSFLPFAIAHCQHIHTFIQKSALVGSNIHPFLYTTSPQSQLSLTPWFLVPYLCGSLVAANPTYIHTKFCSHRL